MYHWSAAGVALEGGLLLSEGNASVASWRLSSSLVSDSGPPSTWSPETHPWFALDVQVLNELFETGELTSHNSSSVFTWSLSCLFSLTICK